MNYLDNKFIFPPRPLLFKREAVENLIGNFKFQLKLDDTRSLVTYTPEKGLVLFTRHGEGHKAYSPSKEVVEQFYSLPWDKNKTQVWDTLLLHNKNELVKDTWILMDILVKDGEYLLNSKFKEREIYLDSLGKKIVEKVTGLGLAYAYTPKIWRAKSFPMSQFDSIWKSIENLWSNQKIIEGVVVKNLNGKLAYHFYSDKCNWQFKVRLPKKNYKY
ncbi:MAG: hypothetical protein DRQ88_06040 [Epsilonproteobacteria bacterium]|nr:MAG: hypothetical protein DRQ88_06040 [Campylobacterota bacterium]